MHRTKVRVVEDALDANNTIARANRDDFDRAGVTRREPDERAGRGQDDAARARRSRDLGGVRVGVLEGDVQGSLDADRLASPARAGHAAQHRRRASAASATSTRTWCARRCPTLPLDEIDLLVIENVGNLVCPAEFRVGEDARVMVSSVTEGEDKPLKYPLMFRACELVRGQQDRPAAAPRLRPRPASLHHLDAVHPGVPTDAGERAHRRGRRGVARLAGRRCRRAREAAGVTRAPRAAAPAGARRAGSTRAPRPTSASSRAEAERIARLCHAMAERFARGGRLVALGASPAARSDARHVAVEFVHPVIVGKRALPALGCREGGRCGAGRSCSPSPTTSRSPSATGRASSARRAARARAAA